MPNSKRIKWGLETERVLLEAGWSPDRSVDDHVHRWEGELARFPPFDTARAALKNYGGLQVDGRGRGIACARVPFELDPTWGLGYRGRFDFFERGLGKSLYPLGSVDTASAILAISESGEVYMFLDDLWYAGDDIEDALDRLIRGREMPLLFERISSDPLV